VKRPARWDVYIGQVDSLMGADPAARAAVPGPAGADAPGARADGGRAGEDVGAAGRGGPTDVLVGGFAVQMLAGSLAANPGRLALLPGLYRALDAGTRRVRRLRGQMAGSSAIGGMPETMDLASGISPRKLAMIEREAKTSVVGDALNFPMPHLLGVVPGVDLGEGFRAPFRIPNRSLLVAGSLDGRTVLAEQAEVAAQFTNKSQILVENSGHNVFEAHPEVQDLLLRFFRARACPTPSSRFLRRSSASPEPPALPRRGGLG
jgi:pimeloyl-ACP methyl ester carboxylesterase